MCSQSEVALRVLMLNRADAYSVPGGDTVQMLHTKAGLEKLGVQVMLGSVQDTHPMEEFDLVHVFNWQQFEQLLAVQKTGSRQAPPYVLSPIFWFYTGHWFDVAVTTRRSWRFLDKELGSVRARRLYERWQQLKFRYGAAGQKL